MEHNNKVEDVQLCFYCSCIICNLLHIDIDNMYAMSADTCCALY